jgi:hypothetical protein
MPLDRVYRPDAFRTLRAQIVNGRRRFRPCYIPSQPVDAIAEM